MGYTQFQQPFFQFCQRYCRRFELTRLTRYSGPLDCGYDYLLVYIQSATPVNDLGKFNRLIHCARILVRGQSYGNNFSFSLASASGHEDFIMLSNLKSVNNHINHYYKYFKILAYIISIFLMTFNTHPLVVVLCHEHFVIQDAFLYT